MMLVWFESELTNGYDKRNLIAQVLMNKKIQRKIVNIFLPINLNICFGCPKEPSH